MSPADSEPYRPPHPGRVHGANSRAYNLLTVLRAAERNCCATPAQVEAFSIQLLSEAKSQRLISEILPKLPIVRDNLHKPETRDFLRSLGLKCPEPEPPAPPQPSRQRVHVHLSLDVEHIPPDGRFELGSAYPAPLLTNIVNLLRFNKDYLLPGDGSRGRVESVGWAPTALDGVALVEDLP